MKKQVFYFGEYDPEADATDEEIDQWEEEDDAAREQANEDND